MLRMPLRRAWLPLILLLGPTSAAASDLRFNQTAAGNVTATGNTLGLSKEPNLNGPGTEDSIGTFITTDGASVDTHPANPGNPWFVGTTDDWTENSSAADLVLPLESEVLYAELVWGGSSYYNTEDVRASINLPVALSFGGDTIDVDSDPLTDLDVDETSAQGFLAHYYSRSADVTAFVAEHGAGTYEVAGVPATQDTAINSLNAAGWTLVVAYRNSAEPIRNLTVFVGGSFVDELSTEDYSFAGFCTPPMGDFDGFAVVSAIEGDADLTGDGLAIAETAADPFVDLLGPNNPVDNFFASQINDPDGNLDTTGTFGDRNHDAVLGVNAEAGRQGWDITRVPLSSADGQLSNGQTEAVLRTQTTDDSFVPTTAAFAIRVNSPDFSGEGTLAAADPDALAIDEVSTITIDMNNVGLVNADDIVLVATLPNGLELDSFTIDGNDGDIDGNPVAAADLTSGVEIGTVGPDTTVQIAMQVHASAPPDDEDLGWVIQPQWSYAYVSCVGEAPLEEPFFASDVVIEYVPAPDTTGGAESSSDDGGADTTGTGAESDSMSASNSEGDASASATATESDSDSDSADSSEGGISDSSGQTNGDDGCGCSSDPRQGAGGLALLGLALGLVRRRRS